MARRGRKCSEIELEEFLQFMEEPRTNKDLCKRFNVSRETIRKDIAKLYNEGILSVINAGKGIYQIRTVEVLWW